MEEFNDQKDYLQRVGELRTANRNRIEYKNMMRNQMQTDGYDVDLVDLDYVFDAGNAQGKDIMPKIEKQEDGTVKEKTLIDMKSKQGLAWAAASKMLYNEMYKSDKTDYETFTVNDMIYGPTIKQGPQTMEEFAQWGIETIGNVNYNITDLGYDVYRLKRFHQQNPETALAFNYLMDTYGKLPMFTWNGTKRFFKGMATDPTTYAGLGTIGVGLLGKTFYNTAGKGAMKETLKTLLHPNAVAMYEGALFGAADDYLRQTIAIEADAQNEYDFNRLGVAAGTGAAFTGAIAGGATATKNYAPYAAKALRNLLVDQGQKAQLRIDARKKDTGVTLRSGPDFEDMADKGLAAVGKAVSRKEKRQLDKQQFYSKAREALDEIQQEKGKGSQFVKQLQNKFGVKPKELFFLGLNKFDNDNSVTKAELIQAVKQNVPVVKEHLLTNTYAGTTDETGDSITFPEYNNLEIDMDYSQYSHISSDYLDRYKAINDDTHLFHMDGDLKDQFVMATMPSYLPGFLADEVNFFHLFRNELGADGLPVYMDDASEYKDFVKLVTENLNDDSISVEQALFDMRSYYGAVEKGEFAFINHKDEMIDFSPKAEDFFDDEAKEEYLNSESTKRYYTAEHGYTIYGNELDGYRVEDPNGIEVESMVNTVDEASVQATIHAREKGYIVRDTVIEEMANEGTDGLVDTATTGGRPDWEEHVLPGGSNYKELVFQLENYLGDPDLELVSKKFDAMLAEHEKLDIEYDLVKYDRDSMHRMIPSERGQFLNNKGFKSEKEVEDKFRAAYDKRQNAKDQLVREFKTFAGGKLRSVDKPTLDEMYKELRYTSLGHYNTINTVGHTRIDDRRDPAGAKFMFVNEAQTDWGQKGRNNMISPENLARADRLIDLEEESNNALRAQQRVVDAKPMEQFVDDRVQEFTDRLMAVKKVASTDATQQTLNQIMPSQYQRGSGYTDTINQLEETLKLIQPDMLEKEFKAQIPAVSETVQTLINTLGIDHPYFDKNMSYQKFKEGFYFNRDPNSPENKKTTKALEKFENEFYKIMRDAVEGAATIRIANRPESQVNDPFVPSTNLFAEIPTDFIRELGRDIFNGIFDVDVLKTPVEGSNRVASEVLAEVYEPENMTFLQARQTNKVVPRGPFVDNDTEFMEFIFKNLIRRAVIEGHEYIVLTGVEDQVDRWGEEMRGPFQRRYEKYAGIAAKNVLKILDKKAKPELVDAQDIGFAVERSMTREEAIEYAQSGQGETRPEFKTVTKDKKMLKIPITDEMRESVKRGMPLFELGGMAVGGAAVLGTQMAGEENQN